MTFYTHAMEIELDEEREETAQYPKRYEEKQEEEEWKN